jgi:hypothetical protein
MAGDPLRTLDIVAGRSMRGVFGGDVLPSAVLRQDPDSRFIVWTIVNYAWALLAAATGVGLILVGVLVRLAFGHEAGHVVLALALGACFFCLAGCANALWRAYWYVPRVRRARERSDQRAYDAAWRHTEPRNSTVAFQLAVGILTFAIAVSSSL